MLKRRIYILLTSLLLPYLVTSLFLLQANLFLWTEKARIIYFVMSFVLFMALLSANEGGINEPTK